MFSTAMPRLFNNNSNTTDWAVRPPAQDQQQQHQQMNFKQCLHHISVPDEFFAGINVFRANKGKIEPATLTLSRDKFVISVQPRIIKLERSIGSGGSKLSRPSILSRGRSGTSIGSVGGSSVATNSVDGADAAFSFSSNPHTVVDIGSIDRLQSGQNTLMFEKAK